MDPLASQHVMGPQGLAFVITKFVGKKLPFLKIWDTNHTRRQKVLEHCVKNWSQTNKKICKMGEER